MLKTEDGDDLYLDLDDEVFQSELYFVSNEINDYLWFLLTPNSR
jgi:hypothetical protein